LLLLEVRNN